GGFVIWGCTFFDLAGQGWRTALAVLDKGGVEILERVIDRREHGLLDPERAGQGVAAPSVPGDGQAVASAVERVTGRFGVVAHGQHVSGSRVHVDRPPLSVAGGEVLLEAAR